MTALVLTFKATIALIVLALTTSGTVDAAGQPSSGYYLGLVGENCVATCLRNNLNCNAAIQTNDSPNFFKLVNAPCNSLTNMSWTSGDQPSYNPTDKSCTGFTNLPAAVACQGRAATTQRVCRC